MRIPASSIQVSPLDALFTRISFTVSADRQGLSFHYWIDLPRELAPGAIPGNAQALLLLPMACYFHEDIVITEAVDSVLLENLKGVQQIWHTWYPQLAPIRIEAPAAAPGAAQRNGHTLASFSGGIDSFFSLLRHRDRVSHLLSIAGFNTPIDDLDNMKRDLGPVAATFGKRLVPVRTNIRYGDNPETPYSIQELMSHMAHGCLLAAIAHLMEQQFRVYVIPATHSYSQLHPYGSHPLTDPLFSSAKVQIEHDGAAFDRIERTELVAGSTDAMAVLHVCWQDFSLGNCSRCEKCLRTMATLDLVGGRENARTFDWSTYSLERVAAAWLPTESERAFFVEIARAARARGRVTLAQAAEAALTSSRRKARLRNVGETMRLFVVRNIKSHRLTRSIWYGLKARRDRARART